MSGHYKNLADQLANHLKQYNIDVEKPVVQTHKVEQQPEQISSEHENAYINQRKEQIHKIDLKTTRSNQTVIGIQPRREKVFNECTA